MTAQDAAEDPHLRQGGAWARLPATEDYPETDFGAPPYKFESSDVRIRTTPALFGEHNDYVYRELLGVSDEEFERLRAAGHIATTFDADLVARA